MFSCRTDNDTEPKIFYPQKTILSHCVRVCLCLSLSVCVCVCLCLSLCLFLSLCHSLPLSVSLCLSLCLCLSLSVCLSVSLFIFLSMLRSLCLCLSAVSVKRVSLAVKEKKYRYFIKGNDSRNGVALTGEQWVEFPADYSVKQSHRNSSKTNIFRKPTSCE